MSWIDGGSRGGGLDRALLGRPLGRLVGAAILLAAAAVRADPPPSPACPHFPPTESSACARRLEEVCTYVEAAGMRMCTCRPEGWHCELVTRSS